MARDLLELVQAARYAVGGASRSASGRGPRAGELPGAAGPGRTRAGDDERGDGGGYATGERILRDRRSSEAGHKRAEYEALYGPQLSEAESWQDVQARGQLGGSGELLSETGLALGVAAGRACPLDPSLAAAPGMPEGAGETERVPPGYREIVRRYFTREEAAGAGAGGGTPPGRGERGAGRSAGRRWTVTQENADSDRQLVETLARGREWVEAVRREVGRVIVGQGRSWTASSSAPGRGTRAARGGPRAGKTLLVRTLARTLGLTFKRVQCTPDLMPRTCSARGSSWRRRGEAPLRVPAGAGLHPRAPGGRGEPRDPKTQSALLEAMQERAVTIAGERRPLEEPFSSWRPRTRSRWRGPSRCPRRSSTASS